MKKDERSGAQALVESLSKAGTEVLFGYPGGAVLDIFNCLPDAPFQFVLGRHEQGCVHMADGYARSTGKAGVCLVTSGPGATNTITGLATANMDGIPLVCITGQVPLSQIGTDAFQEADMSGICRAVTKHSFLVQSADEIPETVAEAFYIATHGKPGPVVIDIPKNVQQMRTSAQYPERVSLRAYHPESMATTSQMTRFAKLVNESKRPVLYAGGGVIASGAAKDVANLAHKAQIPVATTLMGLGSFDERDPLALRLAGMHGCAAANHAINEADLIIALGVRFSDRVTGKLAAYAKHAKIIHVDCDPSSIGKNVAVDLGIVADIKDVLTTVNSRIKPAEHKEWLERIEEWRKKRPVCYKPMHKDVIMPQQVIESIDRAFLCTTGMLIATAILAKCIGCGIGAKASGFKGMQCAQIGFGMACRGEVALVVASKGVSMGLLPESMMAPIVITVVCCAIITPLLLKLCFAGKHANVSLTESSLVEGYEQKEMLEYAQQTLLDIEADRQQRKRKAERAK